MTIGKNKMKAIKDAALPHPQIDTVAPDYTNTDDPCPDPEAIVGFFFNQASSNPELEQHLRYCADCRLKFEALKEAFRRLCNNADV